MNTIVWIVATVTENPYKLTKLNQIRCLETEEIATKMVIFLAKLVFIQNSYAHMKTDLLGNFQK